MLMQPGDTITPGGQTPEPTPPQAVEPIAPAQQTTPEPAVTAQPTPAVSPTAPMDKAPVSAFEAPVYQPDTSDPAVISWTASEYIDHSKGPAWFAVVGIGIFALSVAAYFLLKDILAPVLLALAGLTTAVFAGRRPQVIEYAIDTSGIHIGQRAYSFGDFKSFSLTESGPLPAILLTPLKRFLPPITIFYDPKEEDKIVDALADYLPHEDKQPDMIDRIMGRIRF